MPMSDAHVNPAFLLGQRNETPLKKTTELPRNNATYAGGSVIVLFDPIGLLQQWQ